MHCYTIREALMPSDELCGPYVVVLTPGEWEEKRESFGMGIDLDMSADSHVTKAEVNLDSLTGTLCIPDRKNLRQEPEAFNFALDERGLVLIDAGDRALRMVEQIRRTKKWRSPCLERFLYDMLESVIDGDLILLEDYEDSLSRMENELLDGQLEGQLERVLGIRSELLQLRTHYEQLIDLGQELEENENGFFGKDQLRFFELFTKRVERLQDIVTGMREHTIQVRDLYQTQLQDKQNRLMMVLTVVSTIFLPLTLIAGWFGMNFTNMPLINAPWGYPFVIVLSVVLVLGLIRYFQRKNWFN